MQAFYRYISRIISVFHSIIIVLNLLAVYFVCVNEPWYYSVIIVTIMSSPLVGGTVCVINRIENFFRVKGGLPSKSDKLFEYLFWEKK